MATLGAYLESYVSRELDKYDVLRSYLLTAGEQEEILTCLEYVQNYIVMVIVDAIKNKRVCSKYIYEAIDHIRSSIKDVDRTVMLQALMNVIDYDTSLCVRSISGKIGEIGEEEDSLVEGCKAIRRTVEANQDLLPLSAKTLWHSLSNELLCA